MQWRGMVSLDTIVSRHLAPLHDMKLIVGRSEYALPTASEISTSQGLFSHDIQGSSGTQDADQVPLQSQRVDRAELHLLRKVGYSALLDLFQGAKTEAYVVPTV